MSTNSEHLWSLMMAPYMNANGRRLIVSSLESLDASLAEASAIPLVVLLTAWRQGDIEDPVLSGVVMRMLKRGCEYFVCAGTYAEELHDSIDDIVSSGDFGRGVGTSFHTHEPTEEVANFFVFTTTIRNREPGDLVAVLDQSGYEDRLLWDAIQKECAMSNDAGLQPIFLARLKDDDHEE